MLRKVSVGSAQEMYEACLQEFDHCNITILCAAVADFMPETTANQKIKKATRARQTLSDTEEDARHRSHPRTTEKGESDYRGVCA